jgi:Transcriptional regulator containing an amidase domain and an AraC-type DNA-binding HTH domain
MTAVRTVGFLLFPDLLQLDFTGPYAVLAQAPDVSVRLVAKTPGPVTSSDGLIFQPNASFACAGDLDLIVVPGGAGIAPLLTDGETLAFLRKASAACRFTASVCTGSLVLGAAGLLRGRRATTHWQSLDLLPLLGADPVRERVVFDGDIVTAAGVSAGIDMALSLVDRIWGDEAAQLIQLGMEYSPCPPYDSGSPDTAPVSVVQALDARNEQRQQARKEAVRAAARALPPATGSGQ